MQLSYSNASEIGRKNYVEQKKSFMNCLLSLAVVFSTTFMAAQTHASDAEFARSETTELFENIDVKKFSG